MMKKILLFLLISSSLIFAQKVSFIDSISGSGIDKNKAKAIDKIIDSAQANINNSVTTAISLLKSL